MTNYGPESAPINELVSNGNGKAISDITREEAPMWIARHMAEAGIILGYGYKNYYVEVSEANKKALDDLALETYDIALRHGLIEKLRGGFNAGRSSVRNHEVDRQLRQAIDLYKTPPASGE